jgi:hypothetical protein
MALKNRSPDQMLEGLSVAGNETLLQARTEYFRLTEGFLREPLSSRLLIDKNPSYTTLIPALTRIFPEAQLIVALRDPRDVCLSCFMQRIPINTISSSYLNLADTVDEYASVMNFWLSIRNKMAMPWLEVRYEDMVGNLEAVARRTLGFLNLSWDDGVMAFHQHAKGKIVRSPTYADVGKPLYKTS